jgi:hypothetical protein
MGTHELLVLALKFEPAERYYFPYAPFPHA